MTNEGVASYEKTLGRISGLIKDYQQSQSFLDSTVPAFLLNELSSIKLPSDFEEQAQYFSLERKVLFQLIQFFRQENKVD